MNRHGDGGVKVPLRPTPGPPSVLLVCTGNICRSPMGQGLLTAALANLRPLLSIGSAGTAALVGSPMEPLAARQLDRRGAALPDFRARALSAALVLEADLVLTATREHRSVVATVEPSAVVRTFTFGEIARLLRDVEPSARGRSPAEVATAAHARRGRTRQARPREDDLQDPYGGSSADFARCAARLDRMLSAVVRSICGAPT